MGRTDRFAGLVRAFDLHGCRWADHYLDEWARRWVISPESVAHELRTYLTSREAEWSMALRPGPHQLRRLAEAIDALAAYESVAEVRWVPPTFRLFRHVFIESGAFPELIGLAKRDRLVWDLALKGQGPRACTECMRDRR